MVTVLCYECGFAVTGSAHVRDGNVYHTACIEALDNEAAELRKKRFPEVEKEVIDGLEAEGELDLLSCPYCLVLSTDDNEWAACGFDKLCEIKQNIKEFYTSGSYGNWNIHRIYSYGKPVNHKVTIDVEVDIIQ